MRIRPPFLPDQNHAGNTPGRDPGIAVVTGATRGIGHALARVLAQHGHDLFLVAQDRTALHQVRDDLTQDFGVRIELAAMDLADPEAAQQLMRQLTHHEVVVDILINNAGLGDAVPFADSSLQKQAAMVNLNIATLTYLTRLVIDGMLDRRRGRILNVASTAAFRPGPQMAVYSASKAYVLSFSEALAYEVRDTGVTVTALCPGPTRTTFHERAGMSAVPPARQRRMAAAQNVAAFGYASMMQGKTVAIHGKRNRLLTAALACMPRSLVTAMVGRVRQQAGEPQRHAAMLQPSKGQSTDSTEGYGTTPIQDLK